MGLVAFDPARLDALRHTMAGATAKLTRLGCPDAAAEAATRSVRRARLLLGDTWLARLDSVRSSPAWFEYRAAAIDTPWRAADDPLDPPIPRSGATGVEIPDGAQVQTFAIPAWQGHGTTRIQWFIDDDEVCLSGVGPDVGCGHGDDRGVATGPALGDPALPARARVVLDHEAGVAVVVAYPTHSGGGDVAALPIELIVDGPVVLPDDHPSQVRVWTTGEGIDGNVVFDYRFLNSLTPAMLGGVAPAIQGAIRVRRGDAGTVRVDGRLGQYPTVEIIRDTPLPDGYHSALIHVHHQESGGPLNLFEPPEKFAADG